MTLQDAALFTDLYELTMAAAYLRSGVWGEATFSVFVRRLPPTRNFLVAAGLEDVLRYLETFRFTRRAIDYLHSLDRFESDFLDHLSDLRFTGHVRAVSEGTVIFPDEPLLEITAPIIEAQLVETAVLNACHAQTTMCSKAARCVLAGGGRPVVEFGLRRAPGLDGGMKAARCSYIAGATMTSNVLAGLHYGIPPTGTMAHSFVTAFPEEIDAFRAFAGTFPTDTILLIDTYDTISGAHKVVQVAREIAANGGRVNAVRLDSGDLLALSRAVRRIFDDAGLSSIRIFASGGLDEHELARLVSAGAPIDAFGVGTLMDVSADAPYLDMAYKLVHCQGHDVLKLSTGKTTWVGAKQVFRFTDDGRFSHDALALADDPPPDPRATPLLEDVMRSGASLGNPPTLPHIREHCRAQLEALPQRLRHLEPVEPYPVRPTPQLLALQQTLEGRVLDREIRSA